MSVKAEQELMHFYWNQNSASTFEIPFIAFYLLFLGDVDTLKQY